MNKTALILMPHGSKNPEWTAPFRKLAEDLRQDLGQDAVYLAFMEIASPNLTDAAAQMMQTQVRKARILPLFMARGNHFNTDIPTQIAEAKAAYPALDFELLEPIGRHPRFFELMREVIKSL
ncbi:MAG: CbiX/SirB N-terminal domain-containing protein [Chthoniobacteraceae bacterium]|nr:CbiX/SirB N-terminal domain-containing protein [Chthoniobacteraceae bacterium]